MATRKTAGVHTFTLYVAVRTDTRVDDDAVATAAASLRPDDEELCIWRDAQDSTVLRLSTDCTATDLDGALELGHALAAEALAASPFRGSVEEVVAMADEEQLVWRAQP
jgi:hypothetical protein